MSHLILPKKRHTQVHIVQDPTKFKWAGVPYRERYASYDVDSSLLRRMREIDPQLDIKMYKPTGRPRVIRYTERNQNQWVCVWELDDRPDLGLRPYVGDWIIDALRAGDTQGHARNRVKEVDENNRKIDEANKKQAEEIALDLANEIRKPMIQLYNYGENSDYKGVY